MAEVVELRPGQMDPAAEPAVDVAAVLSAAQAGRLTRVVVVGVEPDGTLYVAASHHPEIGLGLLARGTARLAGMNYQGLQRAPGESA